LASALAQFTLLPSFCNISSCEANINTVSIVRSCRFSAFPPISLPVILFASLRDVISLYMSFGNLCWPYLKFCCSGTLSNLKALSLLLKEWFILLSVSFNVFFGYKPSILCEFNIHRFTYTLFCLCISLYKYLFCYSVQCEKRNC
jgi:hypothetical protein